MPRGAVSGRTQAGAQRAPMLPVHEPTEKGVGVHAERLYRYILSLSS
jgi:hypothetical protein